jgi:1,4-alpha-glucan branching enzyme
VKHFFNFNKIYQPYEFIKISSPDSANSVSGNVTEQRSRYQPKPYVQLKHPEWSKNATIYEVNIRQYTKEGTFKAFEKHLPRLKNGR